MFWRGTRYHREGLSVITDGLLRKGQQEIRIEVNDPYLMSDAEAFLRFVVAYLDKSKRRVRPAETLRYGYWLVKFVPVSEEAMGPLEVWEYNADASDFIPGGSLSVRYWGEQHRICDRYNAVFAPPNPESLTVVSVGVFEGQPAQGMRYPWPDWMSGWLIVTDAYDGNVQSLTRHHTFHITSVRPDLAPYIALPPGFGFDLRNRERVWYDETAVREHLKEFFGDEGLANAGFSQ